MLVLSRRGRQEIHIGENIVVTVLGHTKHGHCRIGIKAPPNVRIVRPDAVDKEPKDDDATEVE